MVRRLARNWWVKAVIQKIIGILPGSAAFTLNEVLVRLVRGNVAERIDTASRAQKCLDNIKFLQDATGFDVDGARVLELGTGWHGIDLVLFHLLGAQSVVTVDHWRHLRWRALREQVRAVGEVFSRLQWRDTVCRAAAWSRMERLLAEVADVQSLDEGLSALRVDYRISASCDPRPHRLPRGSIDLFYSESVLQRVPEQRLRGIVSAIAGDLLAPDGVLFARTDQKDIHSQEHVDDRLWGLEYLRYGDGVFSLLSSEKLNCQNRLRESDFLRMFEGAGIEIERVESTVRPEDVERMRTFRLAPRFRGYEPRDLATTASTIAGRICVERQSRTR